MKEFQDLLALALVGTSRGTLPAPAGTPLADTLGAVQGDPEGVLLSRAALAGMVRLAGRTVDAGGELPAPAAIETLPAAPPRVARHLAAVLQTPLLAEWLALCAEAGWRVPPKHLPALLDLARQSTALRESLRPVLGERGAWLAQFNAAWRFTPAAFSEEAWENATEAQKESLFRDLRQTDPAAARDFLAAQFKTEKVGVRRRLLDVLGGTLTEADSALEPLLEAALTDRSAEVRTQVQALLLRLPHSAYNRRMAGRVQATLHHEKVGWLDRLRGKQKITLVLPEKLDDDAKRDGLELDPKVKNPALSYFRTLLREVHPQVLADTLGISPAELVELVASLGAVDQLEQTTLQTAHQPTAKALLPHLPKSVALITLAEPDKVLDYVLAELRKGEGDINRVIYLLGDLPAPWPAGLSANLLKLAQERVQNVSRHSYDYRWESVMGLLAQHGDPQGTLPLPFAPETDESNYVSRYMREKFNETLTTLAQRREMQNDFAALKGETP